MEKRNAADNEAQPFEVMVRGPFAALLRVPDGGFSWDDGLVVFDNDQAKADTRNPWLVRPLGPRSVRQYAPLAVQDLHRRFSRLEPTRDAIHVFANEYGFLGHSLALRDPELRSQTIRIDEFPVGESLGFWQREIARMAWLLDMWDLVRLRHRQVLDQLVQWTPSEQPRAVALDLELLSHVRLQTPRPRSQSLPAFYEEILRERGQSEKASPWSFTILAHAENINDIELLERWEYGDSVEPARYYLHREVNKQLKNHVSPAVLPYRKGEVYFFPDCLRGALYTLLMLELSGRQRPAMLCARPGCGRYFEPAHGRQQYCEKRCQQLAYYYRRKGKAQMSELPLSIDCEQSEPIGRGVSRHNHDKCH